MPRQRDISDNYVWHVYLVAQALSVSMEGEISQYQSRVLLDKLFQIGKSELQKGNRFRIPRILEMVCKQSPGRMAHLRRASSSYRRTIQAAAPKRTLLKTKMLASFMKATLAEEVVLRVS